MPQNKIPSLGELKDHYAEYFSYLSDNEEKLPTGRPTNQHQLRKAAGDMEEENPDIIFNPRLGFFLPPDESRRLLIGFEFEADSGQLKRHSVDCWLVAPTQDITNTCCSGSEEPYIVLKGFHFDMEIQGGNNGEEPTWHLQFPGEFQRFDDSDRHNNKKGIDVHHCHFGLGGPRLPYPAIDIILLLNMLMEQYQSFQEIKDGDWGQYNWEKYVDKSKEILWEKNLPEFFVGI